MAGFIENLTGKAAADVPPEALVVLPIGAIEQHGPHLPLSVDRLIADSLATATAEALPEDSPVWFLPTLPFSKSNEHAWSPLTMWLTEGTMSAVLNDLAANVASAGIRRIAFLNGHGGNTTMLMTACREIRLRHGLLTFVLHAFPPPAYVASAGNDGEPIVDEHGMGIHGGHDETSVMLHLAPEQVDMSAAVRNVPEWLLDNRHVRFGGSVPFGWLSNDFGEYGHIGDPTAATAEEGKRLFDGAVHNLTEQIDEILAFDFPDRA